LRVLAIGAHPDDIELLCAGTLARYAQGGHDLFIAVATGGQAAIGDGGAVQDLEELRRAEASQAAEVIGARLLWMGFEDGFLFDDRTTRLGFIEAIREARADVVFAHSTRDYHPDHRVAGQLTVDTRILATMPSIVCGFPATSLPHTFFMDTVGGANFEPEVLVDVTDSMETKKRMLSMHESQEATLSIPGMSYTDLMVRQAGFRGQQLGVAFAEAFRTLGTHPAAATPHLLPR
jgi:LmbE family N-acetylglucosaminyl deacetylase